MGSRKATTCASSLACSAARWGVATFPAPMKPTRIMKTLARAPGGYGWMVLLACASGAYTRAARHGGARKLSGVGMGAYSARSEQHPAAHRDAGGRQHLAGRAARWRSALKRRITLLAWHAWQRLD